MPEYTVELLIKGLNEIERSLKGTKVALLGMSYKANVADLRESPSIKINQILEKYKADIHIFDPFFPEMNKLASLEETLEECDAIILATNHDEFLEKITPEFLKKQNVKVVIDGKNVLDKECIRAENIYYKGIGR
jgi:UDP-N-acetyl-D-glucosamine dehydrogenase